MKCPKCEADSRVAYTRSPKRRRVCESGHKFTTIEIPMDEIHSYRGASIRLARLRLLVNEELSK